MQSNDVIEAVTPLGVGISEFNLFPDAVAILASAAGVVVDQGRIFHATVRHLSPLESDIALFLRRVEIPVIGRDGEIAGVLCRDLPPISASRSTPPTQDQGAAIIDEATETSLDEITTLLATTDAELRLLERKTEVEGRQLIANRMRHAAKRGAVSIRRPLVGVWFQQSWTFDITNRRELAAATEDLRRTVASLQPCIPWFAKLLIRRRPENLQVALTGPSGRDATGVPAATGLHRPGGPAVWLLYSPSSLSRRTAIPRRIEDCVNPEGGIK